MMLFSADTITILLWFAATSSQILQMFSFLRLSCSKIQPRSEDVNAAAQTRRPVRL